MQKKFSKMQKDKNIISVIGLGYVGLPLAIELGKFFNVVGFDISKERIISLKKNYDLSGEVKPEEFKKSKFLSFSYKKKDIKHKVLLQSHLIVQENSFFQFQYLQIILLFLWIFSYCLQFQLC